jgi:DNA repair protein RecO (recombination protein O)
MCAEWPAEWRSQLQAQLRALLHVHCGVGSLRTRQIMMDIQSL